MELNVSWNIINTCSTYQCKLSNVSVIIHYMRPCAKPTLRYLIKSIQQVLEWRECVPKPDFSTLSMNKFCWVWFGNVYKLLSFIHGRLKFIPRWQFPITFGASTIPSLQMNLIRLRQYLLAWCLVTIDSFVSSVHWTSTLVWTDD